MTRIGPSALLIACLLPAAAAAETTVVPVAGGSIDVTLPDRGLTVSRESLIDWVETSARTIEHYYGGFPVARLELQLVPGRGRSMRGTAWAGSVPLIRITVGSEVRPADLEADWRLVHELVHTAVPELDAEHEWLHEGFATYIEPVARARYGTATEQEVWSRFMEGMPQGLAAIERRGLDGNRSWGARYWGGALFCLLADVAIRERTGNQAGLQDALAALLSSGVNITEDWDAPRLLETADEAAGGRDLENLHATLMSGDPGIDLAELWRDLGVSREDGRVAFDDQAPLAAIRRAVTEKARAEP